MVALPEIVRGLRHGKARAGKEGFLGRHRRSIAITSLASAVIFVVVALFALTDSLSRLGESFGWVQHTDDVLLQMASIDGNLVSAESAERGFLLTGDQDYVAKFEHAQMAMADGLRSLRALVADNPIQVAHVDELGGVVEARFTQLRRVIALGPSHMQEALDVIRQAAPQRLTDSIHDKLSALRQTELALLQQRQHRTGRDATISTVLAAITAVVALFSAAFGVVLFQREQGRVRERELQTELIHASRIGMMGQSASMLAHEINQPLTAAGNYLAAMDVILKTGGDPPSRAIESLEKATAQVSRAGQIVERLRSFIRKSEPEKTTEAIGDIFNEAIVLANLKSDGLNISTRVEGGLPPVLVDKIQIEQILINLMRNAVEAMQQSPARSIELSADRAGAMAYIRVRDTGPGLPSDVADKPFRPFVSTKKGGMGVGLSICQAIAERNGGRIWIESNGHTGAVFAITLPLAP